MGTGKGREEGGKPQMKCWGLKPCDGLTSHPEGSSFTPSPFIIRKPGEVVAGWATWIAYRLNLHLPTKEVHAQ